MLNNFSKKNNRINAELFRMRPTVWHNAFNGTQLTLSSFKKATGSTFKNIGLLFKTVSQIGIKNIFGSKSYYKNVFFIEGHPIFY